MQRPHRSIGVARTNGSNYALVLLQTAIGDYRQAVLDIIVRTLGQRFHAFAGAEYFEPTTKTRVDIGENLTIVENHFLFGRRLLWQTGMWRELLRARVAILEFNPRILSVWVLLIARRLLGRRSVLWGHAWPRAGRQKKTVWLRQIMGRLGSGMIVYTESQACELREWMPGVSIIAAPNALYSVAEIGAVTSDQSPAAFIYVGRLVPAKKPELLLHAFAMAVGRLPEESRLIFVGEGPARGELERHADKAGLSGRVEFTGHVADPAALKTLFARSIAGVSPGNAGLSITQSLSFGVPMIIARNEPHGPEIEAAREGENALMFHEDNPSALADALVGVWNERDRWIAARDAIARDCAMRYSADLMASRIIQAARGR
ncbi:MAG: glycosyltransferase family 4 protein [Dehalococcoidia bacterium]